MSTSTISIEGVSARYAAQIRELIYEQARTRLIARRQAQREQAEAIREAVNQAPGQNPDAASNLSKTTGLVLDTSA